MQIVINILLVIHVLVSLLIVFLVLMQRPKNEGLGAAFGGGVTDNLFGAQTTNVLQTITRQHFGNDSVAPALGRVCELRDMARDIQSLVGRSFWSRLFGGDHQHDELRQQAYRQLGEEFAVAYRELLSVIDGNFEMHETTNEWRASCRVFVDDFRRRW